MTPTAYGYVRVSTQEQADSGLGAEAQIASIKAYCALRHLNLLQVFTDLGESASKPLGSRPAGKKLLALPGPHHVVIAKLDRAWRDVLDTLETINAWDRQGVNLHLLDVSGTTVDTRSPAGRFMVTIMAAFAEMERKRIRERTVDALKAAKKRGKVLGRPSSWSTPAGQRILALLKAWSSLSSAEICRRLNEQSIPTPTGRSWTPRRVRQVRQGNP